MPLLNLWKKENEINKQEVYVGEESIRDNW